MKNFKEKRLKERDGITLIALVVTIIVLLILVGISISMLSGNNGIIQRAIDAKIESEKDQEKDIVALAYNSALIKKRGEGDLTAITSDNMNTELTNQGATADGSNPIIVTFTDSKRQYTIDTNGIIEIVEPKTDYQWTMVSDNDNDGVLSLGDEVAPLIDSIKDEHFYVLYNNGDSVKLTTKLSIDYVTNSQSSSAPGVTYDMVYCDLEGVEHDWIMPIDMIKIPATKQLVQEESGSSDDEPIIHEYEVEIPAVYYDGTETGKVHCPGTYTKNYGLRLKQAGLNLMDFNSNSGCSYIRVIDFADMLIVDSTDDWSNLCNGIIGNRNVWINYFESLEASTSGMVPYWTIDGIGSDLRYYKGYSYWYDSDYTLRPVIQVDIDLINTTNN